MDIATFITNYREAFGAQAPLPLLFAYSDTPLTTTAKVGGCFFKQLDSARRGTPVSLNADNIGEHIPTFGSLKPRYNPTPDMVLDYTRQLSIQAAPKAYLNFVRIDQAESFDGMEGLFFYATPDILSGLCAWAFYDCNEPDAVCTPFGSGCGTTIATAVRENRRQGYRTFIGLFDPSVRPYVGADELGFVIPASRFRTMYETMRSTCLFGTNAWSKVKARIEPDTAQ